MTNFLKNKKTAQTMIKKANQVELDKVPRQFADYMMETDTRFSELCKLYLDGLSIDDLKYMKPKDLINLVPKEQYRHRLLMTVMVRRYIYRKDSDKSKNTSDNSDSDSMCDDNDQSNDQSKEYVCNNCDHICNNPKCSHSCENNVKVSN